jgi:hypothetical protein
MCDGNMVLRETVAVVHVPGHPEETERRTREWVCSDCEYFEDAEEER